MPDALDDGITGPTDSHEDRSVHDRDRRIAQMVESRLRDLLEDDASDLRVSHARYEDGEHRRAPCMIVRVMVRDGDSPTTREAVVPDSAVAEHGEEGAASRTIGACSSRWEEFEAGGGGAPEVGDRDFTAEPAERVRGESLPEHPDPGSWEAGPSTDGEGGGDG